ncbi:MAG: hypothetical protein WBA97_23775 [Actinophytocola sp.]|uniref:hypothetical protein n=1 Tax=Actinophytocola sp. TaxID=1872138 RepID=UPI003C73AE98
MHSKVASVLVGVVFAGVIVAGSQVAASFATQAPESSRDDQVTASVHRTAGLGEIRTGGVGEVHTSPALFDHHSVADDERPVRWLLFDHH